MRVCDYLHPERGFRGIKHLSCEGVVSPSMLTCLQQYDVCLHLCLQAVLPAYKLGLMRICSLTQGFLAVFIKGCLSMEAPPSRRGHRGLRKLKPQGGSMLILPSLFTDHCFHLQINVFTRNGGGGVQSPLHHGEGSIMDDL